ncbi:MAG TPA: hypothetical protein PLY78_10195, partial [Methanospirillum sp.]|nr:hypothetical protein [Methanospirillum sp.]
LMPLIPPVQDQFVKKAIFADSFMDKDEMMHLRKSYKEEMDKLTRQYLDKVISKADTTESNLMHVIADEQVTYLYKRPYPFQSLIPVEANKGKWAAWDVIGPYDITSAYFGQEDPDLTETNMKAYNRFDRIKYMYTVGRLTKAAQLAGLTQIPARDLRAIRVDMAQDAMRALRERSMLGVTRNLQSVKNQFENAGPLEYAGIAEIIQKNKGEAGDGVLKDKCWIHASEVGGIKTFSDINFYLDEIYSKMVLYGMRPNLAICDYKTFGLIRRGMTDFIRYIGEPVKTLVPGVSKIDLVFPNEGALPLVPHPFLSMMSGDYGSIQLVDTRLLARRILWQDTYEQLANINTSDKFVISSAETLIDKSGVTEFDSLHGGLYGITIKGRV